MTEFHPLLTATGTSPPAPKYDEDDYGCADIVARYDAAQADLARREDLAKSVLEAQLARLQNSGLAEYQSDEGLTFALWLKDGSIVEYNGRTGWTVEIDGRETEIDWDLSQMNGAYEDDFAYVESVVADPLAAAEDAVVTAKSLFSHTAA